MPEMSITLTGHGYEEKIAKKNGPRASHIYLPLEWEGKRVAVVLLEPLSAKTQDD